MDDIFSDSKDEKENKSDSNIEWKKSGIDKHERLTLKTNVREANLYDASKKNELKSKNKVRTPLDVPKGFKKVSKKIRNSMDEEEEEDDYILVPVFQDTNESSLMKALTEEEKKILQQNDNIGIVRQNENFGKEAAIALAEKVIMQAGLQKGDERLLNEQRLKAGKLLVKDVVAETIKQKSNQKPQPEKPRVLPKEMSYIKPRDAESKAALKMVKEAEVKTESKIKETTKPRANDSVRKEIEAQKTAEIEKTAEIKTEPQKVRAEEIIPEQKLSIKEDEKAAIVRSEKEIPHTEEKNDNHVQEAAERTNEKTEEVTKEVQPPVDEKMKAKEEPIKEEVKEPVHQEKENQHDREMRELILAKSGRSYAENNPEQKGALERVENKDISRSERAEKEYQKLLEAQIKMQQNRHR